LEFWNFWFMQAKRVETRSAHIGKTAQIQQVVHTFWTKPDTPALNYIHAQTCTRVSTNTHSGRLKIVADPLLLLPERWRWSFSSESAVSLVAMAHEGRNMLLRLLRLTQKAQSFHLTLLEPSLLGHSLLSFLESSYRAVRKPENLHSETYEEWIRGLWADFPG
jgi:hypothetical protein